MCEQKISVDVLCVDGNAVVAVHNCCYTGSSLVQTDQTLANVVCLPSEKWKVVSDSVYLCTFLYIFSD